MNKIPAFSPISEAMMAALASRAHEWSYWEIEESFTLTNAPAVTALRVALRLERPDASAVATEIRSTTEASPFETVDSLLRQGATPTVFRARAKTWADSNTLGVEIYDERSGGINTGAISAQAIDFTRVKNSLGHFSEVATARLESF